VQLVEDQNQGRVQAPEKMEIYQDLMNHVDINAKDQKSGRRENHAQLGQSPKQIPQSWVINPSTFQRPLTHCLQMPLLMGHAAGKELF